MTTDKTNETKTNTANETAARIGKIYMPIKVHMPITVNFSAPINLAYNGGTGSSEKPVEKVSASDLQQYIAEQTAGQCDYVNPRFLEAPAPIKPAIKNSDCERIDTPIRDRECKCHKPEKDTGVSESTIDDLADSLVDQIDKYFDNLYQKIKEVRDPSSARAVARQREVIRDAFINLITTERESLETHLRFAQIRKNSF